MANFFPAGKFQLLDDSGDPVAGGLIYTAQPNTLVGGLTDSANYKAAYTESTGATNHTNPIVLDSAGRAEIWLDGLYDMWANNAAEDTTYWSLANVGGIATAADVQSGSQLYGEDAGSTDTYAATFTPTITSYTNGLTLRVKLNTDNTGAATFNADSVGAKSILLRGSANLANSILKSGAIAELVYNGVADAWDVQGIGPQFDGAHVTLGAEAIIPNATATNINWDTEQLDTLGFWAVANPERLTIPASVSRATIHGAAEYVTAGPTTSQMFLKCSNSSPYGSASIGVDNAKELSGNNTLSHTIQIGPIDVYQGDYFYFDLTHSGSGTDANINVTTTHAGIIVERN